MKHGYLLRDFENRIVQRIKSEQAPYQVYRGTFQLHPNGQYLYAVCSKNGDHGTRHLTAGGRICRFLLDGKNQFWEEVMNVQQSPADPFSLHDLNVNELGDVAVVERGHRETSLWKYSASAKNVSRVAQVPGVHDFGAARISLDGKWVSFLDQSLLFLANTKE